MYIDLILNELAGIQPGLFRKTLLYKMKNPIVSIYRFYAEGFRSMKLGKTLWLIIAVKLGIMFFVLKLFFFPDILNSKFDTREEKADYVGNELIKRK